MLSREELIFKTGLGRKKQDKKMVCCGDSSELENIVNMENIVYRVGHH